MISANELATILDLSLRQIQRLKKQGIISARNGRFDLHENVRAYCQYLHGKNKGSSLEDFFENLRIELPKRRG